MQIIQFRVGNACGRGSLLSPSVGDELPPDDENDQAEYDGSRHGEHSLVRDLVSGRRRSVRAGDWDLPMLV